jgi:dUTP pyrophosphatase
MDLTDTRPIEVKVLRLPHADGLPLPAYATAQSAGLDLMAAIGPDEQLTLKARERALVPTGLVLRIPDGCEAQVRPRSGLALKHGITVLNSPGTIDADYRGEIKIILVNLGHEPFVLRRGDRIAQLVVAPVARAVLVATTSLEGSVRGAGGFGSTGLAGQRQGHDME